MALYIGTSFVTNSDGIAHKSFQSIGINTNFEFVGVASASDAQDDDRLGWGSNRIAIGGTTILVGANGAGTNGKAYVFDLDGNELGQLIPTIEDYNNNPQTGARFGASVGIAGTLFYVGADNYNGTFFNEGRIFMFDRNTFDQVGTIIPSNPEASSHFGQSIAVGCGKIVVDNSFRNTGATGIGGAIYIYDLDGTNEVYIPNPDSSSDATPYFGQSVAIGNGRIIVGNRSSNKLGKMHIYDLNGNSIGIVTAPNESDGSVADGYGKSVAVGSGRIIVSDYGYRVGNYFSAGQVYLYDLYGKQIGIMTAQQYTEGTDFFGEDDIIIRGNKIFISYAHHNDYRGNVHVFDLDGNFIEILSNPNGGSSSDNFGQSIAVGFGRVAISAPFEDHTTGTEQGIVYIWKTNETLSDYYDEIIEHYRY